MPLPANLYDQRTVVLELPLLQLGLSSPTIVPQEFSEEKHELLGPKVPSKLHSFRTVLSWEIQWDRIEAGSRSVNRLASDVPLGAVADSTSSLMLA